MTQAMDQHLKLPEHKDCKVHTQSVFRRPEHLLPSLLLVALPLHIVDPQSQIVDFTLRALQQRKVGMVSVCVLHKPLKTEILLRF